MRFGQVGVIKKQFLRRRGRQIARKGRENTYCMVREDIQNISFNNRSVREFFVVQQLSNGEADNDRDNV